MNDQEFREKYQPLQVPAHFDAGAPITEQTLYALAQLAEATGDDVVAKIKELHGGDTGKLMISAVHEVLTEWYDQGLVGATESDGNLRYDLHKITQANGGNVDPDKLVPASTDELAPFLPGF